MPDHRNVLRNVQPMVAQGFEGAHGQAVRLAEHAVERNVTGKQELKTLTIDPKAMEGGDVEMLQDLVIAAVNEANRIARESLEREMSNISGGIRLPGVF